jgi:trk system potassium uptake protein TrkA
MNIVIVGGGKVGYYLVKTLMESGRHRITVMEKNPERCSALAEELDCLVIRADGTDIDSLSQANMEDADVLVAVTGQDQDNLVACQLARTIYGIEKTIARVNNPKNHEVFKTLGVNVTVSSTGLIAEMIEGELSMGDLHTLLTFERGELELVEAEIEDSSKLAGLVISKMELPKECIIVMIYRKGRAIIPAGDTILRSGDKLVALTLTKNRKRLNDFFVAKR